VIKRAKEILHKLEKNASSQNENLRSNFSLFEYAPALEEVNNPALDLLASIDPDNLSPKEALEKLYELKKATGSGVIPGK
jgi:DNA mismatch repair protein MutS